MALQIWWLIRHYADTWCIGIRKPYVDICDTVHEFFTPFLYAWLHSFLWGLEHIRPMNTVQFAMLCPETSTDGYLKLKLFGGSMTDIAFEWYKKLAPGSVHDWPTMEHNFWLLFIAIDTEITIVDLAQMSQNFDDKSIEDFVAQFFKNGLNLSCLIRWRNTLLGSGRNRFKSLFNQMRWWLPAWPLLIETSNQEVVTM